MPPAREGTLHEAILKWSSPGQGLGRRCGWGSPGIGPETARLSAAPAGGFAPRTREPRVPVRPPLRGAAFDGWTRRRYEGRKPLRLGSPMDGASRPDGPGLRPRAPLGSTVPRFEDAA